MRISLFQPSNAVRENVIFKALAGPRETDLHQRGFDQNPHMVALRRSSPSTDVRLMSTQELEDYLRSYDISLWVTPFEAYISLNWFVLNCMNGIPTDWRHRNMTGCMFAAERLENFLNNVLTKMQEGRSMHENSSTCWQDK
jgi:hypothetical protein